jgi:hypothetical protein
MDIAPPQAYDMSMKRLTHDQYAEALKAAHPHYELLSQYATGRSKVNVRCTKHGKTYDVTARSLTTTGQALKCCGNVRSKAATQRSIAKALASLSDRIAVHGRLTLLSANNYKTQRSKVLCKCNACGDERMVSADNASQGQGIDCACRLQGRIEHGKKFWTPELVAKGIEARMAAGWSNPIDSLQNALTGNLVNNMPTALYLYQSPIDGLAKYGISVKPEQRSKQEGYGQQLVPHRNYASRVTAILIEQAYKYGYGLKPPAELESWCGRSELTDATPDEFESRIAELERALLELGQEQFARDYCGYELED